MAAPRLVVELTIGDEDVTKLMAIARSRTEPASRVERARMFLAYRDDPSFFGVGRLLGVHHQTVQRCIERAAAFGPLAALGDSARPGKMATITPEAKAWLVSLGCRKAKDFGYPHELWTTRLLARHAREYGPAVGHECLAKLVQRTVCKILDAHAVKPHKIRYYLERRDPEFEEKMAHVLCIYREVEILKEANAMGTFWMLRRSGIGRVTRMFTCKARHRRSSISSIEILRRSQIACDRSSPARGRSQCCLRPARLISSIRREHSSTSRSAMSRARSIF